MNTADSIVDKLKIIYPKITFYHKGDIQTIRFLSEWNRPFKEKINILYIDDGKYAASAQEEVFIKFKRKIEMQSKGIPLSFQHTEGTDISTAILHISLNDKTDILALSPVTRKSFWNNLFQKSITKETAYHIRIPLLAIPIK